MYEDLVITNGSTNMSWWKKELVKLSSITGIFHREGRRSDLATTPPELKHDGSFIASVPL